MGNVTNFWEWLSEGASESATFQAAINDNPRDMTTRSVYADWLQDKDMASDDSLNFLRFNRRTPVFTNLTNGKIWVGYNYTMDEIQNIMRGQGNNFFYPNTLRQFNSRISDKAYNGIGGTYFVTSEKPIKTSFGSNDHPRQYNVRGFTTYYENGSVYYGINRAKTFPDLKSAKLAAQAMANTEK